MSSLSGYGSQSKSLSGLTSISADSLSVSGSVTVDGGLSTSSASISGNITQTSGSSSLQSVSCSNILSAGNITSTSGVSSFSDVSCNSITVSTIYNGTINSLANRTTNLEVLTSNINKVSDNVTTLTGSLNTSRVVLVVPTFTGYTSGNFTVSSSGEYPSGGLDTYAAWRSLSVSLGWVSNGGYNTAGQYTGSTVTTDTSGNSYGGEWWQLFSLQLFSVNSVTIANHTGMFVASATRFVVLGSKDGTNWLLLASGVNAPTTVYNTALTFTRVSYLRVVVQQGKVASAPMCYAVLPSLSFDGFTADGNINCGGLLSGNINCGGTFSGALSQCSGSFSGSLSSTTQSSIIQLGKLLSLDVSGSITCNGSLSVQTGTTSTQTLTVSGTSNLSGTTGVGKVASASYTLDVSGNINASEYYVGIRPLNTPVFHVTGKALSGDTEITTTLPTWVRRITIVLNEWSCSTSVTPYLQLGQSSVYGNTICGYEGNTWGNNGGGINGWDGGGIDLWNVTNLNLGYTQHAKIILDRTSSLTYSDWAVSGVVCSYVGVAYQASLCGLVTGILNKQVNCIKIFGTLDSGYAIVIIE